MEHRFAGLMAENVWSCDESVSGTGSTLEQTALLRAELPRIITRYDIHSMLDIPCGDFHWMQHVEPPVASYLGADIVEQLVIENQKHFERTQPTVRRFQRLDITCDKLPRVDQIFCRDCLVHFSYADIEQALRRIRQSGSTYLLTTVFTGSTYNKDIETGDWRQLNLLLPPFSLPEPLEIFNEGCTEADGRYADKSLALWRVADLSARSSWSPDAGVIRCTPADGITQRCTGKR